MVGLPPMLVGIVRGLAADRAPLEIVAELREGADVAAAAGRLEADVVLLPAASAGRAAEGILMARPRLRLLTISDDASTAQLHRLLPHRMTIDDVSPTELFDAMLGAGRYGAREWEA